MLCVKHRNILQHLTQSSKANSSLSINYFEKAQKRSESDNIYSEVPWGGSMHILMHAGFEEKLCTERSYYNLIFHYIYFYLLTYHCKTQVIGASLPSDWRETNIELIWILFCHTFIHHKYLILLCLSTLMCMHESGYIYVP